jgi:hypothetical protein
MFFEPGILEAAKAKGIVHLDDLNADGHIDKTDLNLALKAKTASASKLAGAVK